MPVQGNGDYLLILKFSEVSSELSSAGELEIVCHYTASLPGLLQRSQYESV